jgi:hypothetical protein
LLGGLAALAEGARVASLGLALKVVLDCIAKKTERDILAENLALCSSAPRR